jgi:hypothetical protein
MTSSQCSWVGVSTEIQILEGHHMVAQAEVVKELYLILEIADSMAVQVEEKNRQTLLDSFLIKIIR